MSHPTHATSSSSSSSSSSSLSPAHRCHPDHLSPVLSFLSRREFAAAVCVCRSWHAACCLPSAWPPPLDVDAYLAALSDLSHLRTCWLEPHSARPLSAEGVTAGALAPLPSSSSSSLGRVWLQASEVQLDSSFHPRSDVSAPVLALVGGMRRRVCLALSGSFLPAEVLPECFAQLVACLQVLEISGAKQSHLESVGGLRCLRALRLELERQREETASISLQPLEQLHQLEFLSISIDFVQQLCSAGLLVRHLSTQHRLRGLHLDASVIWDASFLSPTALSVLTAADASPLPPARLTYLALAALGGMQNPRPFLLPTCLTRLHMGRSSVIPLTDDMERSPLTADEQTGLARLEQLSLEVYRFDTPLLQLLLCCSGLRSLQLDFALSVMTDEIRLTAFPSLAAALPHLEILVLLHNSTDIFYHLVLSLRQLRVLEMLCPSPFHASCITPLAQLSHLHSLTFHCARSGLPLLRWWVLRVLAAFPSLCQLRLTQANSSEIRQPSLQQLNQELLSLPGGLSEKEWQSLQQRDFRLEVGYDTPWSSIMVYQLGQSEDGQRQWLLC